MRTVLGVGRSRFRKTGGSGVVSEACSFRVGSPRRRLRYGEATCTAIIQRIDVIFLGLFIEELLQFGEFIWIFCSQIVGFAEIFIEII